MLIQQKGVARPGSFEEVPVRPPDDAPMEINGAGRVGQSFPNSPEDTFPKVLRSDSSGIFTHMHQMRFHDASPIGI